MSGIRTIASALGIGRPGEPASIRAIDRRMFRSLHLTPWCERMRFGWVAGWNGLYWHNAVGVAGPDWDDGRWLGGMSWRKHGPFVVCRWRRRGSLRSDRQFARNMDCPCPRRGLLWPIGYEHGQGCPLAADRLEDAR